MSAVTRAFKIANLATLLSQEVHFVLTSIIDLRSTYGDYNLVKPLLRFPLSSPDRQPFGHFFSHLLLTLFLTFPAFAAKKISTPQVNRDQEIRTRDYMIEISRQLGVTCNYCHDVKNFRVNNMKTWKKGKEHMRIVELLNTKGFVNGPKADCYLCHRGKAIPDYKENPVAKSESH